MRAISKPLYDGFRKIEDNINQDFRKSRLSTGDLELSDQAYTLLALLCKDEACAYVRSAEDGNCYQAWQALSRARTARNATNLLNQLLEPTFTSPDPRINVRQWNKNAEGYATRTVERVSDGIRRAVYMNKIAPQGVFELPVRDVPHSQDHFEEQQLWYSLLPASRAGGKKSDRRRGWHFMERGRRPRKRRDPEGRSVWDCTHNHDAAWSDFWLKPGFSSSSSQPSRP